MTSTSSRETGVSNKAPGYACGVFRYGWTLLIVAVAVLGVAAGFIMLSGDSEPDWLSNVSDTQDRFSAHRPELQPPSEPTLPGAVIVRGTQATDAYYFNDGAGGCTAMSTSFGTQATAEEVADFYEDQGFVSQGEGRVDETFSPDVEGELVRWKGTLDGPIRTRRFVDVARGDVAGTPEWATAITLYAPDCRATGGGVPRGS